jgi:protein gp37
VRPLKRGDEPGPETQAPVITGPQAHAALEARWTGEVQLVEHLVRRPLTWRKPRRIFVNSMSDFFHERVPVGWQDRLLGVMALCPQHQFLILTKRPAIMRAYASDIDTAWRSYTLAYDLLGENRGNPDHLADITHPDGPVWPPPNVWLGVSVEDQATADERIPLLLETPAAVRFISAEPLLGPVNLHSARCRETGSCPTCPACLQTLDWVIAGGESGPEARPMHPSWPRQLRDQCTAAGVPFFFKQWGHWRPSIEHGQAGYFFAETHLDEHGRAVGTWGTPDFNARELATNDAAGRRIMVEPVGRKARRAGARRPRVERIS